MNNILECMFAGSLIDTDSRKGWSAYRSGEVDPITVNDGLSSLIVWAVNRCGEDQWHSVRPDVDSLVSIILAERGSEIESPEVLRTSLYDYANVGAASLEAFQGIESTIKMASSEVLLNRFASEVVPKILNDPVGSVYEKFSKLQEYLQVAGTGWKPSTHIFSEDDQYKIAEEFFDLQASKVGQREMTLPVEWGYICKLIPAIQKGLLYILKANTGHGKSSALGQIADYLARGYKVAYLSLEDQVERKIMQQMCRLLPGVAYNNLRRGDQRSMRTKWQKIRKSWAIDGGGLTYAHCPGMSASQLIGVINRIQEQYGCDVVFIDYLGKVDISESTKHGLTEASGLAGATEQLKQRAEERGREVALFLGSQITMVDGKPRTRGSEDVQQKAQAVIYIERSLAKQDEISNGVTLAHAGEKSIETIMNVEKNNDGGTGIQKVVHIGPRFMFCAQEWLGKLDTPEMQVGMPVMKEPSEADYVEAEKIDQAYKKLSLQTLPFSEPTKPSTTSKYSKKHEDYQDPPSDKIAF